MHNEFEDKPLRVRNFYLCTLVDEKSDVKSSNETIGNLSKISIIYNMYSNKNIYEKRSNVTTQHL